MSIFRSANLDFGERETCQSILDINFLQSFINLFPGFPVCVALISFTPAQKRCEIRAMQTYITIMNEITRWTTRDETHVGFTGEIISNLTGEQDEFWINFNIRAKYLYWGMLSKISVEYPITSNFKLGLVGGVHYIFAKNFSEDTKNAYMGITSRIGIVK